ncbi:MAG: protease modulator HflC [Phycisphaeraceae bacterium]
MKNQLTLLIGIVLLVVLLSYMFTYQVRYDEVAVLTTFDRAVAPQRDPETGDVLLHEATGRPVDPGSLRYEPGLYFKAPWPIQKVRTYPHTIQLVEDQIEQVQTSDGFSVVVKTYLVWRIDDPYAFFQNLENVEAARRTLVQMLRNEKGVISSYAFEDLVNADPDRLRLREIEQQMADELRQALARANYGVRIEEVGIRRILLPETVTEQVFARMRSTRERLAEVARAEGQAQAATIRVDAETARQQILDFAGRRAQAIRDEGAREAAGYYAAFGEDEEFAVFLRQIEALEAMLAHNTTFVMDAQSLQLLNLFNTEPGAMPRPTAVDPAREIDALRERVEVEDEVEDVSPIGALPAAGDDGEGG